MLTGRVGRAWKRRVLLGLTISGEAVLIGLVAIGTLSARAAEGQEAAAAAATAARETAAEAQRQQQELEELRSRAPQILAEARRKLAEASAALEAEEYGEAYALAEDATQRLAPLKVAELELAVVNQLLAEVGRVSDAAGPLAEAHEALESARAAAAAEHADAVAAQDAYLTALSRLEEVSRPPTVELAQQVRRVKRELERKARRVAGVAADLRLDRRIEKENLLRVDARALFAAFRSNEVAAQREYGGRLLAVEGVVQNVSTDLLGTGVVHLRTRNQFIPVDARMTSRAEAAELQPRDRALLRCRCDGVAIGRPQLSECSILQYWR